MSETERRVKCPKCGFQNLLEAKYCSDCRVKLPPPSTALKEGYGKLEALSALHLVGSLYVLFSIAFNTIIQHSWLLAPLYLASGVLGLFSAWMVRRPSKGTRKILVKVVSASAIAVGFAGTIWLFLIGLALMGVVGPAWLIFLLSAWRLWKDRSRI